MADGDDGRLSLSQHRQSISTQGRRRPSVLVTLFFLALSGAGAFYVLKNPAQFSSPALKAWIEPKGNPDIVAAQDCLYARNLSCAEADLLAYVKKYPNDPHGNALLAMTLTEEGDHEEALYYYKRAAALGVDTYDFDAAYARTLQAMGDIDGAIARNEAALKLVPNLVDVRGALADQLVRKGRKKEALELLTSFDANLESEGSPPYFAEQIQRIKTGMGAQDIKEVSTPSTSSTPGGQTEIAARSLHGTLAVPVSIDGSDASLFAVDSGAAMVMMPDENAALYFKKGLIQTADYRGEQQIELANGTIAVARIYTLRSVKVGNHEVKDVVAAIYHGSGPSLLGQSFLRRFKSWSIDNNKRELVLNE